MKQLQTVCGSDEREQRTANVDANPDPRPRVGERALLLEVTTELNLYIHIKLPHYKAEYNGIQ